MMGVWLLISWVDREDSVGMLVVSFKVCQHASEMFSLVFRLMDIHNLILQTEGLGRMYLCSHKLVCHKATTSSISLQVSNIFCFGLLQSIQNTVWLYMNAVK